MAFWGIEVKPGKPYTHSTKDGGGRLRISQATLANGSAPKKSLVQCNVGDKSPVFLCALLPDKTESLQLDLEFEEAEDVIFSVIGPRGVYLTGYYVGHNRQSIMQDDTESYGEDIANSETQESNHCSDEDEYEDSFINDDEPEPLTPSPVSSSRDDDDGALLKKKRNGNGGRKKLRKKYQFIESDDETSVPEIDDNDCFPISLICKNKKSEASGKKANKETIAEIDNETKNEDAVDSRVLDSMDKVDVQLVDGETKGKGDQPNTAVPILVEVVPEKKSKPKKKRQESSKEENEANTDNINDISLLEVVATEKGDQPNTSVPTLVEVVPEKKSKSKKKGQESFKEENKANTDNVDDKFFLDAVATEVLNVPHESLLPSPQVILNELKTKKKRKEHTKKGKSYKAQDENHIDHDVLAAKDDQKPDNMGVEVLDSAEVFPEKNLKPKKKRKGHSEVNAGDTDNNLLAGNKEEDDRQVIDKNLGIDSNELANGNQSEEKKVKKRRRKTSKEQDVEENKKMDIEKENKPSVTEPEGKAEESESYNKKTLSNGLVIEDLVIGKSKGKVAAAGKKVKVQYVVKLKENGQVIDSNGNSPHKLRLGDKEVIEGLNVGLEGMRVGDKRRVTVPPSMSLGYKGTGENVPPNSWLVYDVEMTSIH